MLDDVRQWAFYPIVMPITKDGRGPATIGKDADRIVYEVWDHLHVSHGEFDNLPDAINAAMRLNREAGDGRLKCPECGWSVKI